MGLVRLTAEGEVSVGSSDASVDFSVDLCGVVACGEGEVYEGGSSSCDAMPFVVAAAATAAPRVKTR